MDLIKITELAKGQSTHALLAQLDKGDVEDNEHNDGDETDEEGEAQGWDKS